MRQVYMIRHGETTWNAEGRWAGKANPPLSDRGREQALEACDQLKRLGVARAYSSPLVRAKETAAIIAGQLDIPLQEPIPGFAEWDIGDISGMTSQEIEHMYPDLLEPWRQGRRIEPPGAEPWDAFVRRVLASFEHIDRGKSLLVVHEGVLRAVAETLGEQPRKHANLEGRWLGLHSDSTIASIDSSDWS